MKLIEKLDTISELKKEGTAMVPLDAYKGIYAGDTNEESIRSLQTLAVALEKDASFMEGLKGALPDKRTMGMMAGSALLAPVLAAGGRGVAKGISNIHDKLTFNRDLRNITELNPNLDPEDKYTQMAYKSMRTLNPVYAKDPLIANTLLTNIMRERDKHGVPMMMPQRTKDMVDAYSRMRTPDYFSEDMSRSLGALPGQMLESRLEQDRYDRQLADRRQDYQTQRTDRQEDYSTQRDDRRQDMKTQEEMRRDTFDQQRDSRVEDAIRTEYGKQTGELTPQGINLMNKYEELMGQKYDDSQELEVMRAMIRSGRLPSDDESADMQLLRSDIERDRATREERPATFSYSPGDQEFARLQARQDFALANPVGPMQEGELVRIMQEKLLNRGEAVPQDPKDITQAYQNMMSQSQSQQSQPQQGQPGTFGQFKPPTP